jgi:hypothetical protein
MKTLLIVTLGARDVQLRSNIPATMLQQHKLKTNSDPAHPDVLFLQSARKDGEIISRHFDFFKSYLKYPIVKPAIEYVRSFTDSPLYDLILVHTDQNPPHHGDTRFFAHIITRLIQQDYPQLFSHIHNIKVQSGVMNYDTMYDFFSAEFNKSPLSHYDRKTRVVLLPQGGIDQINTALMLKCFEHFPNLIQLAKPEGTDTVQPHQFNRRFYTAINKKKILHFISHFYYHLIDEELTTDHLLLLYARYAAARLMLDRDAMEKIWNQLLIEDRQGWISQHMPLPEDDDTARQKEYYLALKITLKQKNYTDFLIRLSALHENMLRQFMETTFGIRLPHAIIDLQRKWSNLLQQHKDLTEFLNNYLNNYRNEAGLSLDIQKPSKYIYQIIFNQYAPEELRQQLIPLFEFMQKAGELRNRTAHQLKPILPADMGTLFEGEQEEIMHKFDHYFKIEGFDVYDKLNERITSLLDELPVA